MKSRKVLLGLIVGFAMCLAGTATAQKANFQSNKLVEIGPDNIGGRVTSLIVVGHEDEPTTIYAGAATGGLYVRSNVQSDSWRYLPCYVNGEELTLPISAMTKLNDSLLVIATGEGRYTKGNKVSKLAALGRGIFLFNTNTETYTLINGTNPGTNPEADFAVVNQIAQVTMQGVSYLYVATGNGLYRWNITSTDGFNANPTRVFEGAVSSIVLSKQFNRAFFSNRGSLYKISDIINASTPVNITGSCEGFGNDVAANIKLALSPSDESYLYAMVSNNKGLLSGVYLTRNTNTWQLLSSSTVTSFSGDATANNCGAITVSPTDPTKVIIGGSHLWTGKGYVENSPYQWSVVSSSENELNFGDYMAYVYSNSAFVHSGIMQIVSDARWNNELGVMEESYYIATEGGVFYSPFAELSSFENFSRGLNNVQINSLAVTPDGSIISGANANACPFIESRMAHNGGNNDSTWYDNGGNNTNHLANILWKGNGGAVAASQFNQYRPIARRPIIVSSANGSFGRAYADFSNYTNTQTWTRDRYFSADMIEGGPEIGQLYLWETNNTLANEVVTFNIDTLSYVKRNGERIDMGNSRFQIKAGDSILVLDPAHAYYPFWHVFDHNFVVRDEIRHTIHAPYASRLVAVTVEKDYPKNTNVSFCWVPTDFRKTVASPEESSTISSVERFWSHIYGVNGSNFPNMAVRYTAMSKDGDCVFVVVEDKEAKTSFVARVHGFNSVDYTMDVPAVRSAVDYKVDTRVTHTDTIQAGDTTYFFPRRISSIAIDPRDGKDAIVLTFDGYNNDEANVVYIDNATSANPIIRNIALPNAIPAYSAMVEKTTGEIYVGTEEGVFKTANVTAPNWQVYGAFKGVPVTAMYQMTADNKLIRHIGHDGVNEVEYIFPKSKWANAMYFGTYGRGIFMDTTYVTDHANEIVTPDIYLGVPTVANNGLNTVRCYPNPAVDNATLELNIAQAGNATVVLYDLTGKVVLTEKLGKLAEGIHTHSINCQNLQHGMYLVNVLVGGQKATSKLIVR